MPLAPWPGPCGWFRPTDQIVKSPASRVVLSVGQTRRKVTTVITPCPPGSRIPHFRPGARRCRSSRQHGLDLWEPGAAIITGYCPLIAREELSHCNWESPVDGRIVLLLGFQRHYRDP